jgi:ligand-binding sensor domain-containing protein
MQTRIFIAIISLLLFASCCLAQVPSPLIFDRITKKEGLISNTTFQTIRDKQGFLWIATQNGLQRYDRHRFLTFRHTRGDTTSIVNNSINHLFIDGRDRLWLLFDREIGMFNTVSFKFNKIKVNSSVGMIKKMMEDGEGRLMLFADGKLFLFDETKQSFDSNYPLSALPAGYSISDLAIDKATGLYWFTGKQGSLFYDPKAKKFILKDTEQAVSNPMDSLAAVKNARYPFIAKDGSRWLVNWVPFTGPAPILFNYDKKKNKLQRFEKIRPYKADSYYEIWNVFQQSNGTTWVYGMGLLAYYNPGQNRFIHINSDPFQQNGIEYDYVTDLYEDREKNVWVSTNNGVYRFNVEAQVFRNIKNTRPNDTAVVHNAVSNIVEMQNGEMWVSTWGAGIFSYNKQLQPVPNPITTADPENKLLHASYMIQRRNGEVWIGTHAGGLKIYEPATGRLSSITPPALQGQIVSQLFEDHNGSVWIGSTAGLLVKCERGNWQDTAHAYKSILAESADIMKLYEDGNKHLWVCTASNGVYEMDPNDGRIIQQLKASTGKNNGLLNNGASDVVQYSDSIMLIASEGICILNTRTNSFRYIEPGKGLPPEHITNLVLDKQKRLWVALDGGLCRLNIDSRLLIGYEAADGITGDVFQVASARLLSDGRIAMGTPHDFLVFDPEKTVDKKKVPAASITGFALGDEYLSFDSLQRAGGVRLSYNNTAVHIDLSTLSFRDWYYMFYKLDGLDKDWKPVYNNEIIYPYLPPGDYTLRLKSKNGEGVESETTTSLRIEVSSPFWKTWWFYSLLALLAVGLFFWLDHIRIKRKTAILQMRSDIADDLHQDINQTLGQITILSEIARLKADREPEKSKEFIGQIHTRSQTMTRAMDDILWSIDPNNDSMKSFVARFREYVNALKVQYSAEVDILVDKKAENLQLAMKVRNDIFWLFKSGITNALRTGGSNCSIHITYEKPNLIYTLEFDTAVLDMKQLNNIRQREELSARLEALHAKLVFKEHKKKAGFVLSIPVRGSQF